MSRPLAAAEEPFFSKLRGHPMFNYVFILPALAMFLIFSLYPYIDVFILSLFRWDGISPDNTFVWFRNYADIITSDKSWWISFKNAGYITLLALVVQNSGALILAWLVDRKVKGAQFYRSIFFLPPIISGIVIGLIWTWIFQPEMGILNRVLSGLGLDQWTRAWFSDQNTALTSLAVVHMWRGFGWGFIILLAGLQGIPRELYEAARVDGAGEWSIFWRITVPQMIPVFVLVSVLTILGTMQIYDLVVTTTQGGPGYHTEVPMKRIIDSIGGGRLGYASAQGVVFGIALFLISIFQIQISKTVKAD